MRRLLIGLVLLVLAALPSAAADDVPDATIGLSGGAVAAAIGYTWDRGRLIHHAGRLFRLKVNGLSIVDVGVSSYTASGDVYNLKKPPDILGTYTAIPAADDGGWRSYGNVNAERA